MFSNNSTGETLTVSAPEKPASRVAAVRAHLKETALRLGPGAKLPTVRELHRIMGVGTPTIMDALRDLEKAGVIDRRHGSGIYVSKRIHQKTIALVFGSNIFKSGISPFYPMMIRLCQQRTESHNERFSFFLDLVSTEGRRKLPVHQDLQEAIESGKLHGILQATAGSASQTAWLRSQGLPVVGFESMIGRPHTVAVDYVGLIRQGVNALADQGCQRIGLIAPRGLSRMAHGSTVQDIVLETFAETLDRRELTRRAEWIWVSRDVGDANEESGCRAARELLGAGRSQAPDGLVIADDMMTRGALTALRGLGLAVGRDVKIATHANLGSPALKDSADLLTLIEFDPTEIVEAMFGLLERLMNRGGLADEFVVVQPVRGEASADDSTALADEACGFEEATGAVPQLAHASQ